MKNLHNSKTINGQYYYDVWYEIFRTDKTGETQTICETQTKQDAKNKVTKYKQKLRDGKLLENWVDIGYDQWGSLDEAGINVVQI